MADFQPIPINGTAEQLEKLLGMDIVESITENPTNDQIPTALAVKNAIESGGGGTAEGAVLYTAQNLTPEQQAQARKNIGVEEAVLDILLALALVPAITDVDGAVLAESDGTILLNL